MKSNIKLLSSIVDKYPEGTFYTATARDKDVALQGDFTAATVKLTHELFKDVEVSTNINGYLNMRISQGSESSILITLT